MANSSMATIEAQAALAGGLARGIAVTSDPTLADLVRYRPAREQPFHRWFRYREGYAPGYVERAIEGLGRPPGLIVDPFCGSGTTLLAARQRGIASAGIDFNPVSTLIARVKTRNYGAGHLRLIQGRLAAVAAVERGSPRAPGPALRILDRVFRSDVLDALLAARWVIDREPDRTAREFLLAGWLAVLEPVSNVFKEGNGIKYRNRRRTAAGYETVLWETLSGYRRDGFEYVREQLAEQYRRMLEDIALVQDCAEPAVYMGSALAAAGMLGAGSADVAVFSPPYCNNFNYTKIFKVELWMGGFVGSYAELRALNRRALRSHVELAIELPAVTGLPEEVARIAGWIEADASWHRKLGDVVLAYFLDMREVLRQMWAVLRPGGSCVIAVGNSAYGGVLVPTDLLLALIAQDAGFVVERFEVARHLTTSSQQRARLAPLLHLLRETSLSLRKA